MSIPLQNFLVVEFEIAELKQSAGGIWIVPPPKEQSASIQFQGIVVRRGPEVKNPDLKPGTIVAINQWGQQVRREEVVKIDGKDVKREFSLIRENDIIAILTEAETEDVGKIVPFVDAPQNY
jgi:co-chaperonin GroES (HSP10)